MTETQALWDRIYDAFEAHRFSTDPDAQAALNRIAAKCLRISPRSFDPSNCGVREEMLSLDELSRLKRFHADGVPRAPEQFWQSIVVVAFEGQLFVVDGNNRVNKWVKEGRAESRKVIVIEPHVRLDTVAN